MCQKKKLLAFCIVAFQVVASTTAVTAQEPECENKFRIGVSSGYAREDLNWSIAGQINASERVNILSELDWKNLSGISVGLDAKYNFYNRFVFRVRFSTVIISSGKVTDTDFAEDDRKNIVFRDRFNSNKGSVHSGNVGLGYDFTFLKTLTFAPYVGYSIEMQNFHMLGDLGNITGELKSTYKTTWSGISFGYLLEIPVYRKISILHQLTCYQLNYSAKANWNLIEEYKHPVSFKHDANGFGIVPEFCVLLKVNHVMSMSIGGRYDYWKTGKGTDTLYRSNGEIDITQFNGATRNGVSLTTGVAFSF